MEVPHGCDPTTDELSSRAFWLLLSAVDPTSDGTESLDRLQEDPRVYQQTSALARPNGLYYPFVIRFLRSGGELPANEGEAWNRELQALSRYTNTICVLGDVAQDSGIEYVVIKEANSVEHVPRDVDVFVGEKDLDAFVDRLTSEGLTALYRDEAEISLVRTDLLRIDVYSRIRYLGRDFVDPATIWSSRRIASMHGVEFPGLAPESAYLINSIHGLLGHSAITLLDFLHFMALQRTMRNPAAPRNRADAAGWARAYDLWTARLRELQNRIYGSHESMIFPMRHGTRFVLESVASLDGPALGPRDRVLLNLSLLWDDLVHVGDSSGISDGIRESPALVRVANTLGHGLRTLRGDRKFIDDDGAPPDDPSTGDGPPDDR